MKSIKTTNFLFAFFCVLIFSTTLKSQTTIVVGNQSSGYISEKYPFDDYYNYSWSNVIYLNSEIGQGGTISKVAFYVNPGPTGNLTMTNQKIYMKNSTVTSYTNGNFPGETGFTLVYNGSVNYNVAGGAGWITITLNTPFAYDGTSNLEMLF